jgi:cysteine desulfurase/selenocysteine lyase
MAALKRDPAAGGPPRAEPARGPGRGEPLAGTGPAGHEPTPPRGGSARLDPARIRKDFPVLQREVHGRRIVYLDSAASSQKPQAVIDAMSRYYETTHANVHRGVYEIAEEATRLYEEARAKMARFLGASDPREVVFTKNVTEALNLVVQSWGRANLGPGDAVLLTEMEHHANLVPWLMLAAERGIELRYLGIDDAGELVLDDLEARLDGVKAVGLTLMSNVLGTLPPFRKVADAAHAVGAIVVADGAQYVPHLPTSVTALGCDFLGFTGHKMLGPTGIGGLWGRRELLEAMPPFLGGGEMIRDVRLDGFEPTGVPWKFEAGTPPIAEAVGLAAAIDYLEGIGMDAVREHEIELTGYAMRTLRERYGDALRIHGPADPGRRGGVLSLAYRDVHPHDLSQVLDQRGVCVRAGHHCAKPLMRRLGVPATARASFYIYNDERDVDALADALAEADALFCSP